MPAQRMPVDACRILAWNRCENSGNSWKTWFKPLYRHERLSIFLKVEFANPWCLLFLPLVPLFVWWWLKRPRQALPFSDLRFLVSLSAGNHQWMRWVGAGLRGAGLLLAILALAGPRWPDVHRRI